MGGMLSGDSQGQATHAEQEPERPGGGRRAGRGFLPMPRGLSQTCWKGPTGALSHGFGKSSKAASL